MSTNLCEIQVNNKLRKAFYIQLIWFLFNIIFAYNLFSYRQSLWGVRKSTPNSLTTLSFDLELTIFFPFYIFTFLNILWFWLNFKNEVKTKGKDLFIFFLIITNFLFFIVPVMILFNEIFVNIYLIGTNLINLIIILIHIFYLRKNSN